MGEKEQRQFLAMRLASGTATAEERDKALAEILLSLWTEEDLTELFDRRCEARRKEGKREGGGWFRSIFSFSVR